MRSKVPPPAKTENLKRVSIRPGEFHVSVEPVMITTLLGSCVSACLYDPVKQVVGMNHFLLGTRGSFMEMPPSTTDAGRYGVHAMELVINGMMKLGARRENLRAKAFGGGSVTESAEGRDDFYRIGEVNSRFIVEFLRLDGIPLIASDLGGDRGRVIHFCSDDFSVYVRKIQKRVTPKLIQRERTFWKIRIEEQDRQVPEPDLWLQK
jgi:chemotaxis protein CheD